MEDMQLPECREEYVLWITGYTKVSLGSIIGQVLQRVSVAFAKFEYSGRD